MRRLHPELDVEIEVLHTTGDRITDVPLAMIGVVLLWFFLRDGGRQDAVRFVVERLS